MTDTDINLANQCYKHLKEMIVRGDLHPGEKLKIAKLKELLNVGGPTPIREALNRLTASGLVRAEENRGFYVREISEEEVHDVYTTFTQIELLALNQSIERGDIAWEGSILAALHPLAVIETSTGPVDASAWLNANYAFHLALISQCGSPTLLKIRHDIYSLFDRYCHLSLLAHQENLHLNHEEHKKIAQAAIHRDKDEASRLMISHLENSQHHVLKRLKAQNII